MKNLLFALLFWGFPFMVSAQTKRTIHVATAGTLSSYISKEEKYQIEELTLTGEINGDDLGFIREMAGKRRKGNSYYGISSNTEGKLASLDISKVKIVVGGIGYEIDDGDNVFESTVTRDNEIPPHIFSGCKNLVDISISNDVNSIGTDAFEGTAWYDNQPDGLVYIGKMLYVYKGEMPANTSIKIEKGTIGIACSAFGNCKNLVSIEIPNSVTSIGGMGTSICGYSKYGPFSYGAFYGCTGLASITIPNSVTSIGDETFEGCSGLTSITIPNSVTSIVYRAFYGCSGLTSITIPNSVTSIGDCAFYGCSGLTSISIPNSVTSIGGYAFYDCSGLTSIIVGAGNSVYDSRENCNAIIETASNTLIAGCQNTIIPNSVTSIGSYAFYGCSGLTSISIPNSVTSIGYQAFEGCSSLTSITIPNSVTSIGYEAFESCSGLTSITIPNSVTSIGSNAFEGCSGLMDVYCISETIPETSNYAFGYQGKYISNAILHVPAGSISAYSNTEPWSYFKEIVALSNESTDEPQGDGYHFFVVKAKDGTSTTFALADEPKITNNNGELTIQGSNSTFKIRLSDVQSFKFLKQTTGINSIIKDEDVRVTNDCVVFDSLSAGSKVSVYMADGTLVKNFVADGNGSLVIGLSELPKGILVLHSARTNIKVINK